MYFQLFLILLFISFNGWSNGDLTIREFVSGSLGVPTITQSERDVPVVGKADVVIAGGGVAGVMAALQAASQGHSVIILESRNYLGYELTASYRLNQHPSELYQSSLALSIHNELSESGIIGEEFNPEALKSFLHKKVSDQPNIDVYFFSRANGVIIEDDQVKGVLFNSINGRQILLAKSVVDATSDMRVAQSAGAELVKSYPEENISRRFVKARIPSLLEQGSLNDPGVLDLGIQEVIIHSNRIELVAPSKLDLNIEKSLSSSHAITLNKCFELKEFLFNRGITLGDFQPAPETWFDHGPVIKSKSPFTNKEMTTLTLNKPDALKITGVEGLIVAGRGVSQYFNSADLEFLLAVGELAGKISAMMAEKIVDFPELFSSPQQISSEEKEKEIKEVLEGFDASADYPVVRQKEVKIPILGRYDVVVVGGGTSGSFAAISSAREGAKTAVVELISNLGGTSTNKVTGYYWGAPWKSLLRQEVGNDIHLVKDGSRRTGLEKVRFSGEDKKYTLQKLAMEAGVDLYFHSLAGGVVMEGNEAKGVVVENSNGRHILLADVVIDATGLAGMAVAAGAGYDKGRSTDGFVLEMEHGPLRDPNHIPDISSFYLKYPSPLSLSIRESRRVKGDYTVTFQDAIAERKFEDNICRWRANYDTHFPNSANQTDLGQDWTSILGLWRRPIVGNIPYRSILPQGIEKIMVVGKSYSTDHDALIGGRMQPDLEHLGEAAGIAAAIAAENRILLRELDINALQEKLVNKGVLRNEDLIGKSDYDGPSKEVLHSQDYWKAERDAAFPPDKDFKQYSTEQLVGMLGTEQALEAMTQLYIRGKESIPYLKPVLKTNDQIKLEEVVVLLGLLGDRSSVPYLLQFLKERNIRRFEYDLPYASSRPSLPLYWSAIVLLGRFGEKAAVPEMLNILNDSPKPERMISMDRSQYGNDMFETTNVCPPTLASFTIVALGRIGDPVAIPSIKPFLKVSSDVEIKEENTDFELVYGVKTNAIWALSQLGDKSGIPYLEDLMNADQFMVRDYAKRLKMEIK